MRFYSLTVILVVSITLQLWFSLTYETNTKHFALVYVQYLTYYFTTTWVVELEFQVTTTHSLLILCERKVFGYLFVMEDMIPFIWGYNPSLEVSGKVLDSKPSYIVMGFNCTLNLFKLTLNLWNHPLQLNTSRPLQTNLDRREISRLHSNLRKWVIVSKQKVTLSNTSRRIVSELVFQLTIYSSIISSTREYDEQGLPQTSTQRWEETT